jgi:hypothetical protein
LLVKPTPRNVNFGSGRFAMLNKEWDISSRPKSGHLAKMPNRPLRANNGPCAVSNRQGLINIA